LKVFVALEACDMRKGFNGLNALVTERLGEDPAAALSLSSATGATLASRFFTGTGQACG
jgi:transposase